MNPRHSNGITTTDTLGYPATSNKVANMTRAAATLRSFVHDAGGNITSDNGHASIVRWPS